MAEILPFIGTRYNSQLIGNLNKVIAPPSDALSPEQQEELCARHDNNVAHLEHSRGDICGDDFSNKYTRAANTLKTWRSDGILIEDEKPSIYLYEQEFRGPTGETNKRRGFFALVKLEDNKRGECKASEDAPAGSKADLLQLMRATRANLNPIFVVYNDQENKVLDMISQKMTERPWEEVPDDDGVIHRLWVIQRKDFILGLQEALKDFQLFTVDGHYQYETALNFRNEMRKETGKVNGKQPFDYMMMFLTHAEQEGLAILPTHRLLSKQLVKEINLQETVEELEETFEIEEDDLDLTQIETEAARVIEKVQALGQVRTSFGMILGSGKVYYLQMKDDVNPIDFIDDEDLADEVKRLDVSILHHFIINQVMIGNPEFELEEDECFFVREPKRVFELLKSKKASIAFILNPTTMDQVTEIISAGITMPYKSAYFHPKIISGLVIRNMDCENKKPSPATKKIART